MKNKMLIGVLSASLIFGGAVAVGAVKNDDDAQIVKDKKEMISIEKVEDIALSKAEGYVEGIELEIHKGNHYYKVDIEGKTDYDIFIDAYTGKVLAVEEEYDDDDRDEAAPLANQKIISKQEAIAIAEKLVNGTMIEINLDEDDGHLIYELELKTNQGEAEVDIDAVTGKVLEFEHDDLDD